MRLVASASKGMIKELNQSNKPTLATNSIGWEVQKWVRGNGWIKVNDKPFKTQDEADTLLDVCVNNDLEHEYRVYEAINFPVRCGVGVK